MKRIYTPRKIKKILIVDDDQAVASIYQSRLQHERFEVDIANSGESALLKLEIAPVDIVILDLSLPGMDGVEILKSIRLLSVVDALPVIVFSNAYVSGLMQAAVKAGATKCVNKSACTPHQMVEIIREVLDITAIPDRTLSEQFEEDEQAKLVAEFCARAPRRFGGLRAAHHAFVAAQKDELRLAELYEMSRQTRRLAGAAGVGGFRKIAQLAGALEAMLFQLHARPAIITPSTTRTIAQAIDRLAELFGRATSPLEPEVSASPTILVVDDEIISREAIESALKKANLAAVCLEDSIAAEVVLKETHFDLIFLDVEMPGQSGLDLCASIQKMATNSTTPVVFVTCHSDFESRARTSLSGGKDFISKPFLPVELAVKALTWLFKEAQSFSIGTSHGENINERQTAEAGLEQHSYENKPKRPHAVVSSRN
jgi:DNA-binding response OmpR family regulator